jgi:DNA primase
MFKGRIVIPIHDIRGNLVGYAGRVIDDRAISETSPKYKLPPPRERDNSVYEFHKSLLLYNAHRLGSQLSELTVVEGFPSVWWLTQHGIRNVVAVMGSDCSEAQAEQVVRLVHPAGRIRVLTDGDAAGYRCAEAILRLASRQRFVRWVKLDNDEQPTDLSAEAIDALLIS